MELRRWGTKVGLLAIVLHAPVGEARDERTLQASVQAQRAQADMQSLIDEVDDETRDMLEELRRLENGAQRLEAYNEELEAVVRRQEETLARREAALASAQATRETLPALTRDMVERLERWIEGDMPFLRDQRRARVESLETMLTAPGMDAAERLDRVLSAWRAELDYGREMDAWRGMLDGEREVDFLRLGRVGLYYLTPDGREGGVWRVERKAWQPLEETARSEVRDGLKMARDRRAPALLSLPVSRPLQEGEPEERS